MNRILYLAYYIHNLNWVLLEKFLDYVSKTKKRSKFSLSLSSIYDSLKYNISILEYFQFKFFEKTKSEKAEWAGTGYLYEYQLKMNPKSQRAILDDKRLFIQKYKDFILHQSYTYKDLVNNNLLIERLLNNRSGKIVFKTASGKCGKGVLIQDIEEFEDQSLLDFMTENKYDLVESYILQHRKLQELAPSAVNTVRVFTQLNHENQVDLLGCRLRISVVGDVDNLAAGNIAAPIDEITGRVNGPGVYSDITKGVEEVHPVTKIPIVGFQVPYWDEIIAMVKKAALQHPQNRSIGWDVVVTEDGPGLIEGNHDWCKLLWQLPAQKGMKNILLKYV